jgi:hypothetical protein
MPGSVDPGQAAERIADQLQAAGISYALGGALALGAAGFPRGTADVDVNVFVESSEAVRVAHLLQPLGIDFGADAAIVLAATKDGLFIGQWDGMRIDVFVPSVAFSYEAERTRVHITNHVGWSGWFLSPEALAVFKLMFFRGKDLVDLERLVAGRRGLDVQYVRRWIVDMFDQDDPRVQRWDDLVRRFRP